MKIGIIGLGLIGGSLALAIKEKTDHLVYAANRTFSVLERAANEGAIDGILEDPSEMDLLILTAYPAAAMDWLKENGAKLGKNQTVVDCCGTKQEICASPLLGGTLWPDGSFPGMIMPKDLCLQGLP